MLRWMEHLYLGETVKKPEIIIDKLNQGRFVPFVHLVTLSEHQDHLLEILPAATLYQKILYEQCPEIIGIANGKEEAMKLVSGIIQEVYKDTGNFGIKEYLKNR